MAKYRKKPVVVDAWLWDGSEDTFQREILPEIDFAKLPNDGVYKTPGIGFTPTTGEIDIPTLEGTMTAKPGDYIIKGVQGELYPCRADIFEATYDEVADTDHWVPASDEMVGDSPRSRDET